MKRAVSVIALCDMIFILFLYISGAASGIFGRVVYYLAYLLPSFALFLVFRDERKSFLRVPRKDGISLSLVSFFPFLGLIILISYLSSLALGLFGVKNEVDVSGAVFYEIIRHALLPAILEELLFRVLPIGILCRYSKKNAVLISALLFAFAHCNLFQIPYAFVAGVILGVLLIACDSIILPVLFHFVNNLTSVFMLKYGADEWLVPFYISLAAVSLVSLVIFAVRRRKYLPVIKEAALGEEKLSLPGGAVIFVTMSAFIAIINLFSLL